MSRLSRALLLAALFVAVPAAVSADDSVGLVDTAAAEWHLFDESWGRSSFAYGNPGDLPVAGDWDGNGTATPGLYRQSDGFFYARNANTTGIADAECFAGDPEDVPLSGDWDGDGDDTIGLYRPSVQRFFLFTSTCQNAPMGTAQIELLFGNPGDTPVAGDWDGDGADEIGLYRESTGFFYWRNTPTTGAADGAMFFGDPGDRLIAGDWGPNDGVETPGVYRPSAATFFFRHSLVAGIADSSQAVGTGTFLPVAGDFGDLASPEPLLRRRLVGTFTEPLYVDAPFGDGRLFVVEKAGRIRVVDGATTSTFLDISNLVDTRGEQGLLGLAFHPGFSTNKRFYVHYVDSSGMNVGSNAGDSRIVEYRVGTNPNVADHSTARTVLTVDQPFSNHNGGMLRFGADGYLYVGLGDGGSGGDPLGHGQNTGTLLGSILRLDVDGVDPYTVPASNPFVGGGGLPEIYVHGVRNPWRFWIDGTTMFIGDVGQNQREEVSVISGPANLGWNTMEGLACFSPREGCDQTGLTPPVLDYVTDRDGCSVIAGPVYRGAALPGLDGRFFYGDFCSGFVRSFRWSGAVRAPWDATAEVGVVPALSSFGTDGFGNMYVTSLSGPVYALEGGP